MSTLQIYLIGVVHTDITKVFWVCKELLHHQFTYLCFYTLYCKVSFFELSSHLV